MRSNYYYRQVFGRKNHLKEFLLTFFLSISSAPKLLLEVFIRKNFGERYFSFSLALFLIFILFFFPFGASEVSGLFRSGYGYGGYSRSDNSFWSVIGHNILWYLYLAAFLYFCLKRRSEIKHSRSSFDFGKFSKYSGDIHPRILELKKDRPNLSIRIIETSLEPAIFFIVGLVLALLGQGLGWLILICSIIYSLSNSAAYYIGDNAMLDIIDKVICNDGLKDYFMGGKESNEQTGFRAYGRRPSDPENGRRAYENSFDDFDEVL